MRLATRLSKLGACDSAIEWVRDATDAQATWEACNRPDWLLWLIGRRAGTRAKRRDLMRLCLSLTKRKRDAGNALERALIDEYLAGKSIADPETYGRWYDVLRIAFEPLKAYRIVGPEANRRLCKVIRKVYPKVPS